MSIAYPHIETRYNGKAYIAGTGFKVRILVQEHLATGWKPEEMCRQHPPLTVEQLQDAFAYYRDHKDQIDREIEEGRQFAERLRAEQGESLLARKLRELGRELP